MSRLIEAASGVWPTTVITRVFEAPRRLVFQAWTDPLQVPRWWGPGMFTVTLCEMNVRPGGALLVHMQAPDGTLYPTSGVFEEIVAPERLVFTSSTFEDEHGVPRLETRNTLMFSEHDGKTTLTLQAVVLRSTPELQDMLAGMEQGWSESFARLAAHIRKTGGNSMQTAQSKDGTTIAYDRSGSGPAIIVVASALSTRADATRLAALLAENFTVFNYDRRGRGDSGDTQPYTVEREVEDIEALIDAAGGTASIFGSSSGAVLALEAASKMPGKIGKAVLFEPPFVVDDSRPRVPADYATRAAELVAQGRRGDAVELFMSSAVGVPEEMLAYMKQDPSWAEMEATAHTLTYDGQIMGETQSGKPLPADRWASASMPILVLDGAESPPWMRNGAQAAADILPNARRRSLEGQDHSAVFTAPEALAPVLVEFVQSES